MQNEVNHLCKKSEKEFELTVPETLIGQMAKIFDMSGKLVKNFSVRNIRKKWTMPLANWGQISQQLAIKFDDRWKIM